jgi:hypothetical protein
MYEIETWENKRKYGYLGFYLIKSDIYQDIPESWNQKPKLLVKKNTIIEVIEYKDKNVYEEQFNTNTYWFKRNQLIPIKNNIKNNE